MAIDLDLGDLDIRAIGGTRESADGFGAALNDIFGVALDEYLADEIGL